MADSKIKEWGIILKNFGLCFAIFLLTLFVAIYGIKAIYGEPKYDDFCKPIYYQITNQTECADAGGKWVENPIYDVETTKPVRMTGSCQAPIECNDKFQSANERYSRNKFIIAVPLAILIIALGAFVFNLSSVGVGLMFGGIGTLIYGAGGYWGYADNLFKFIISLIGLIVLIFLAYWFNRRFGKKK